MSIPPPPITNYESQSQPAVFVVCYLCHKPRNPNCFDNNQYIGGGKCIRTPNKRPHNNYPLTPEKRKRRFQKKEDN